MKSVNRKWLLALAVFCFLVPSSFASKPRTEFRRPDRCRYSRDCRSVPDGGSTLVYLLSAGAICAGAIVIRTRSQRSTLS